MAEKTSKKRYILVEYCEMCPHLEVDDQDETDLKYLCEEVDNKEISKKDYDEGNIPDWCPLPKED